MKKTSSGAVGNVLKHLKVEIGRRLQKNHLPIRIPKRRSSDLIETRKGCRLFLPNPNRINTNPKRSRRFRSLYRRNFPLIVRTVSQQNQNSRLILQILKPVRRRSDRTPDRRPIFNHSDLQIPQSAQKPRVIRRRRTDQIRKTGESDQPDPIVRTRLDKLRHHSNNRGQPILTAAIDHEIVRPHRRRKIDRQHDVNSVDILRSVFRSSLRPGKSNDSSRKSKNFQPLRKTPGPSTNRSRNVARDFGRRKTKGRPFSLLPGNHRNRRNEEQKPKKFRLNKSKQHHDSTSISGCDSVASTTSSALAKSFSR